MGYIWAFEHPDEDNKRYKKDDHSYEANRYRKIRTIYDHLEDYIKHCKDGDISYDSLISKVGLENGIYYEFLAVSSDEYNENYVDYDYDSGLYYEEEDVERWVENLAKIDVESLSPQALAAYNYMDEYVKQELEAFEKEQGALKDKPKELQKKIHRSYLRADQR
jgi:hypothetical protein